MNGISINNFGCKIYFIRHAQSLGNIGKKDMLDCALTKEGREQAKELSGHYDVVYCSPLRRTKETLHYSKITYDKIIIVVFLRTRPLLLEALLLIIICDEIREMVQDKSSLQILEQRDSFVPEDISNFWKRASKFTKILENECKKLGDSGKILIISHGFFFNGWYRHGCFPAPEHAKLIELC